MAVTWREPHARHYSPDDAGGLCDACGHPMVAQLAGVTTHPTCDPDYMPMMAVLERQLRREKR